MILVDTALARREDEGNPVRVGLVGAGRVARAAALQILNSTPGMRLCVIANRTTGRAREIWAECDYEDIRDVDTLRALDQAIDQGAGVVSADHRLLSQSEQIDVILEVTGATAFGAEVALAAIDGGKHFVTMSAELDSLLGPILRKKAKDAGVVYTVTEGDQPGVELNLYRWVKTLGLTPLVCGNIKGMIDFYRTPETQAAFAKQWGQDPYMVTSFADGTKVSQEQAVVANATGMCVGQRGMYGPEHREQIDSLTSFYDVDELKALGGVVDYALGSEPSPGVYVFASQPDTRIAEMLHYAKMGEGPLYSFYIPYHLFHLEVPISVARAALFGDTVVASDGPIRVEVVSLAKRDLKAGETLDGIGGFCAYGVCENAWVSKPERLLPIGLADGCVLTRDVAKDQAITLDDVTFPDGRLIDRLRAEQDAVFEVPKR